MGILIAWALGIPLRHDAACRQTLRSHAKNHIFGLWLCCRLCLISPSIAVVCRGNLRDSTECGRVAFGCTSRVVLRWVAQYGFGRSLDHDNLKTASCAVFEFPGNSDACSHAVFALTRNANSGSYAALPFGGVSQPSSSPCGCRAATPQRLRGAFALRLRRPRAALLASRGAVVRGQAVPVGSRAAGPRGVAITNNKPGVASTAFDGVGEESAAAPTRGDPMLYHLSAAFVAVAAAFRRAAGLPFGGRGSKHSASASLVLGSLVLGSFRVAPRVSRSSRKQMSSIRYPVGSACQHSTTTSLRCERRHVVRPQRSEIIWRRVRHNPGLGPALPRSHLHKEAWVPAATSFQMAIVSEER